MIKKPFIQLAFTVLLACWKPTEVHGVPRSRCLEAHGSHLSLKAGFSADALSSRLLQQGRGVLPEPANLVRARALSVAKRNPHLSTAALMKKVDAKEQLPTLKWIREQNAESRKFLETMLANPQVPKSELPFLQREMAELDLAMRSMDLRIQKGELSYYDLLWFADDYVYRASRLNDIDGIWSWAFAVRKQQVGPSSSDRLLKIAQEAFPLRTYVVTPEVLKAKDLNDGSFLGVNYAGLLPRTARVKADQLMRDLKGFYDHDGIHGQTQSGPFHQFLGVRADEKASLSSKLGHPEVFRKVFGKIDKGAEFYKRFRAFAQSKPQVEEELLDLLWMHFTHEDYDLYQTSLGWLTPERWAKAMEDFRYRLNLPDDYSENLTDPKQATPQVVERVAGEFKRFLAADPAFK